MAYFLMIRQEILAEYGAIYNSYATIVFLNA